MKIRLLLFLIFLSFTSITFGQVAPAFKSLQRVSVAAGAGYKNTGNSKIEKQGLSSVSSSPENLAEVNRVYAELMRQKPTATLSGAALSGSKLLPGVYRVNGNVRLQKSLELLGSKFPNGVFVFQIEGDLTVDPSVEVALRQGIRSKNVFWQVKGNTKLGPQSTFKGNLVAAGNISSEKGATIEGKVLSKNGGVALSGTSVSELGGENISDLEVTHTVSDGPYGAGLIVTYNVTLKNLGPDDETNVVLNFETTSGLSFLSATTSMGSLFNVLRKEWVISKFPSGAEAKMVVKASIIKTEFSTTIVTVTGDGTDPNIKNNSSELSICATPSMPGAISGKSSLCINTPGNVYRIEPLLGTRKYTWTLPAGWVITSGQESNIITVSTGGAEANGTISVKAVNACGEGPESVLEVSTVSSPPPMPSSITGPLEACLGQRDITYSINSVPGAVSYAWELPLGWTVVRGQGTPSITVNAGTLGGKVKVTAENGCGKSASSEAQVVISPTAPLAPGSISGPAQVCANTDNITYQVPAVLNATGYTWTVPAGWSIVSGQGTSKLVVRAGSAGGQVTVKAQNSCGVSPVTSLGVSINSEVPVLGAISGEVAVCLSNAERTYSVEEIDNGTSYTWSVPANWRILSGQGSRRINVKVGSSGEVKLVASNACGTGAEATLKVAVNTGPPVIPSMISGITAPCKGQEELTYSVASTADVTGYTWSVPEGWTIVTGQGTGTIKVKAGAIAGSISVFGTNGCGNGPVRTLQVAPVLTIPVAPASITGETAPCLDGQQTYSVPNPVAGLTYTWSLPIGWNIISGQGTASVVVRTGTTAGQVTVTASNNCGLSASTSIAVTPTTGVPALSASIQGEAAVCANATQLTYSISSTNAASSFQWQVPAGWTIISGQGTSEIQVKAGTGSGNIQVSARNGCGQSTTRSLAVSVSSAIPVTPGKIAGTVNLCANMGEVTYSITGVSGATTYIWAVPATWTIVRGQGTPSLVVRVGSAAGQVQVVAGNACGNSAASVLPVNLSLSVPAAIGTITGDKAFCYATTPRTYTVSENAGVNTFTWTVPTGWTILSGQGTRSVSVRPGTAGGYLKVVAANNCGTTSDSTNITVSQPLTASPTAITGPKTACISNELLTYSVEAVPGATQYAWEVPTGWQIMSGQNTRSIQVKVVAGAGTVSLVASNACGASATVRLEVTSLVAPILPAGIIGETMPCGGGTEQTYSVRNAVAGMTYTWEVPAGWQIVSGQGTGSLVVKVGNTAGAVSVKAMNGCGTSSAQLLVVAPSVINPATDAIQGSKGLCFNTTQTYSVAAVTGATGFQWQVPTGWTIVSGQGTREIQVKAGTNAGEVSVSTQYGCGSAIRRALAVTSGTDNLAVPALITGNKGVCANEKQITYSIQAVTGATEYEWQVPSGWVISSGQGTTSITVQTGSTGGQITVKAKNVCTASTAAMLAVSVSSSAPFALGTITGQTITCTTSRVTYQVAANANVNAYTWTVPIGWVIEAGQGTNSITVVPGASGGAVSVSGVNGCGIKSTASTLQVQVQKDLPLKPNPIQVAASALAPCAGQNGLVFKIDAVNGATSYEWNIPADWKIEAGQGTTTLTVTAGSTSGQISVVARNACGQSESRAVAVVPSTGSPVINGEISGGANICATAGAVTYSITGSGATQYLWTVPAGWTLVSGQNTTTISVIPTTTAGTIKVKAQNNCGLSVEKSLTVTPSVAGTLKPGVINGPIAFCASAEQRVYTVTQVPGAASYEWTVPAGWQIISGQGSGSITVTTKAGAGNVSVKAVNPCGGSAEATLSVTVANALGVAPVIIDESSPCVGNQFSVPAMSGVSYKWSILTEMPGWSITSGQGTNKITVQAPANAPLSSAKIVVEAHNGTCSTTSASLDIVPKYLAPELHVPNVFSPNNDGKNDVWVVQNLLEYPENELVILNRWGSEVYRIKKYRNNWTGGGLAEGTYYFVLRVRLCEGQEVTRKGYVTIMR
ncbi:ice-binding family protein [Rufibacter latericius]|nr:ice-binding family protein [Rufibacter latericius]